MSLLKTGRPSISKEKALKKLEDGKDISKLNINIAKDLHKEVKRYALENDTTITEIVHLSLKQYIKK